MIDFESELLRRLKVAALHPDILHTLQYAVIPAGKLFRPKLLEALCIDLRAGNEHDVRCLGSALELHHAYSLVHDDLPCMDNDLTRRGKPSTHAAFGEWKALLAGDVLLALSYSELERLKSPLAAKIRKLFHWATGAKGLILGQWMDLGLDTDALRMHELKTARLMQIATAGAFYLAAQPDSKKALRLGKSIGLAFQLLDDLEDLAIQELNDHERAVNPFLKKSPLAVRTLIGTLESIRNLEYPQTKAFLLAFLQKKTDDLSVHRSLLSRHVDALTMAELQQNKII